MTGAGSVVAEFLARQVELMHAGDAAGLAERYHEDAVLVRFDRVARGRAEIRSMLADYLDGRPTLVEQQAVVTTEDVVLYRSLQIVRGVEVQAVGTFVFRDGLVWRQTASFTPTGTDPGRG